MLKPKTTYYKCPFKGCKKEFSDTTWKPNKRVPHFGLHLALKENREDEDGLSGESCGWCGSKANRCTSTLSGGTWKYRCRKSLEGQNKGDKNVKDSVIYKTKYNKLFWCRLCNNKKAVWQQNWSDHVNKHHRDKRADAMAMVPQENTKSIQQTLNQFEFTPGNKSSIWGISGDRGTSPSTAPCLAASYKKHVFSLTIFFKNI